MRGKGSLTQRESRSPETAAAKLRLMGEEEAASGGGLRGTEDLPGGGKARRLEAVWCAQRTINNLLEAESASKKAGEEGQCQAFIDM